MEEYLHAIVTAGGKVAALTLATAQWIHLFGDDHDHKFLIEGVAYGFDWPSSDPKDFYEVPNYVPTEYEHKVTDQMQEELAQGRITATTANAVCGIAAIGLVDKQRSGMVKYRVVHDYSRPVGDSVNDYVQVDARTFPSFATACKYMVPDAYMCKVDLSAAYRSVPMARCWWRRHAFQWKGVIYQDLRMPFGNSGAPAAFDRITQAVVRLFKAAGHTAVVGYLDDFWLLTRPTGP